MPGVRVGIDEVLYGRYKGSRDAAWNALLDFGAAKLPVGVGDIFGKMGISVAPYSRADMPKMLSDCGLADEAAGNLAITIYTDRFTVLYNAEFPEAGYRFRLAHELAHILLGHKMREMKVGWFTAHYTGWNGLEPTHDADEIDANRFAERLLAPACVLFELERAGKITADKETMVRLCGLPPGEASGRERRLRALKERGRFYESELEKQVAERFKGFIESYK